MKPALDDGMAAYQKYHTQNQMNKVQMRKH